MREIKEIDARKQYQLAFWITLGVALALIVGGFFVPPMGEVSGSVITCVGLIFLWPALSFANKALEQGKKAVITRGDTTISVGDADESMEG